MKAETGATRFVGSDPPALTRQITRNTGGKGMTNREYAKLSWFMEACLNVGIEPTKRQASKFRMKKGKVYKSQR